MSRSDPSTGATARSVRATWPVPAARAVRTAAGTLALLSVAAVAGLRVALNAPGDGPAVVHALGPAVRALAAVGPAAAALALGALADAPLRRMGLLAVGVFAGLAALVPAAAPAAAGAVAAGGGLAALDGVDRSDRDGPLRRAAVPVGLLAAVALALGGATGTLPAAARGVGSWAYLAGVALTPLHARSAAADWFLGGLAAVAALAAGATAPYVTGAVALVVVGPVDAPLLLLAAGLGGGVAATAALARTGRRLPALGVATALLAGVPSTAPRASAVVVGLALLVAGTADRTAGVSADG